MTLLRPELLEIYWDSEFRKWARAKLAERQEAKAAKASEAKAVEGKEDAKEEGADADKAEAEAEEEPERLDSSEFKLTFNPDAFVEFKVADPSVEDGSKVITPITDESDASIAAVRQASDFLRKVAIPRFVTDVAAGLFTAADGGALSRQMHARGINIRYLGYVARLCAPEAKSELDQELISKAGPGHEGFLHAFRSTVLHEMVLRASKRVLRGLVRDVEQVNVAACVSHFLNCLVGDKVNAAPQSQPTSSPLSDASEAEWTQLTPESLKQKLVEEIRKRYRFELPLSFFDQELRRPQLLREVALRAGVQLKLQDYVLEGKPVEADGALSDDSHGEVQANGNAKENGAGVSGKKNKNKKKGSNGELNGSKKTAGSADKKPIQAARTTSFEPSDVLNLVPVVKDSTPKSTLAEEAFDAGRLSISRGDRDLGWSCCWRA